MLWDDEHLYVGFWVEEPDIRATLTERDSMICRENDVEVFIAGQDAYYEFELNALGTIMERFYIWQDRYIEAGYADIPEFALIDNGIVDTLGGHWSGHKSARGRRWCFRSWDMPGLQWAVHLDGTINDSSDVDQGWFAEIAFPWQGLKHWPETAPYQPKRATYGAWIYRASSGSKRAAAAPAPAGRGTATGATRTPQSDSRISTLAKKPSTRCRHDARVYMQARVGFADG